MRKLGEFCIHENIVLFLVSEVGSRYVILLTSYNDLRETEKHIAVSLQRERERLTFTKGLVSLFELEYYNDGMTWCDEALAPTSGQCAVVF